jgi:hypothetical protein
MFRRVALSLALAAGLIFPLADSASAAIGVGAFAAPASLAQSSPVEDAQYVYGGRNYCFYNNGWKGPGWYWCGYAARTGYGWGGAYGWRGWHYAGATAAYRRGAYHGAAAGYRHGAYHGAHAGHRHGAGGGHRGHHAGHHGGGHHHRGGGGRRR